MVSSSVRTMGFISNQAVSTRKEISSESKIDDFAKVMDESIGKTGKTDVGSKVKSEKTTNSEKVEETEMTEEAETIGKSVEDKEIEAVDEKEEVKVVEGEEFVDVEDTLPEEIVEEVLNVVAVALNITVSELKDVLEKLNMSGEDLLDTSNVTKVVMDLNNIETNLELLVHSDANDTIKSVQKAIEEVMESMQSESNINVTEEVKIDITGEQTKEVDTPVVEEVVKDNIDITKEPEQQEDVTSKSVDTMNTEATMETEDTSKFMSGNDNKEATKKESDNDTMLNNTVGEFKDGIINEIEVALEERVDETVSTRIVREIADNISVAVREKMTALEMQLNPESLGKVTILLATEESGITAKITAETEMAKNAIEQQLTILRENLDKQGIKVTDIEVTIASHGFEENLDKNGDKNEEQQKKTRGIRKDLLDEINGVVNDEEQLENIVMQTLGNTVSYLA